MSKSTAVPPEKKEIKATEVAAVVVQAKAPVIAESVPSEAKQPLATAAAVEKLATKPKVIKKTVAAKQANMEVAVKQAPAPKAAATKAVKKPPVAAKEKVADTPKAEKAAKVAKVKKPKLVRDSFTIPETDYALFATLKQRALAAGVEVKKSEILRAAVVVLANLTDAELVKAIGLVERIKTGRPKK